MSVAAFDALGRIAAADDARVAWLFTDLLRYEAQLSLRMRRLAIDAKRQG